MPPRSTQSLLSRTGARPLLALRDASVEWQVGLSSRCAATVRVLDRVYFAVAPRECILVHHNDPAGVSVLLAALAGDLRHRPPSSGGAVRGTHIARAGVRIRRTSIRADLIATVTRAWESGRPHDAIAGGTPTVHLLRASRRSVSALDEHAAWARWACSERDRGGAVVIVTDQELDLPQFELPQFELPRGARLSHVHEALPVYRGVVGGSADTECPTQAWRLRHGRLVPAIRFRGTQ